MSYRLCTESNEKKLEIYNLLSSISDKMRRPATAIFSDDEILLIEDIIPFVQKEEK